MKITLLALYNVHSHGIRGLHSFLEKKGHNVESVYFKNSTYTDSIYTNDDFVGLFRIIEQTKPEIIGIAVHSPMFPLFISISEVIRQKLPGCKIIAGGPHATAAPEDFEGLADYVIVGEGEQALLEILEGKVEKGVVGPFDLIDDLDSLPFPYYGGASHCYKASTNFQAFAKYSMWTSRGCYYNCAYCHESVLRETYGQSYRKIRRKSVGKVMDDVRFMHKLFSETKIITFADSIFTHGNGWVEDFCNQFAHIPISFWCAGHANIVTEDMLAWMKEAGLKSLRIGVQSGSERIRNGLFNRKDTLNEILELSWKIHNLGLLGQYDFIINNPYDDAESLKETRDFIKKLPSSCLINHFELRWFPGTPITKKAMADGMIDSNDVASRYFRTGNWTYSYMLR